MSKIKKNSDLSMFWPDFGEERISGGSLISLWAVAGIGGSVRVPAHHLDPRTGLVARWWGAAPTYFASYFPAGLPPPLILEPASGEWLTGRWVGRTSMGNCDIGCDGACDSLCLTHVVVVARVTVL